MSTKMQCTLCESQATRGLCEDNRFFPLCDVCMSAFSDPKSAAGRVLRRAAKTVIKRIAMRLHADRYATPEHRAAVRIHLQTYKARPENRLKYKARNAVAYAVRTGRLVRPDMCQRCGAKPEPLPSGQAQIWFHHTHGYEEPYWLVGEWLCRHCHSISEPQKETVQ